jgi:hypothetical protein
MSVSLLTALVLRADSDVAAVVGDRVFNVSAPQQGPSPYIVLRVLSDAPEYMLKRYQTKQDFADLAFDATVEVSCFASSFSACDRLGEAVKLCLMSSIHREVETEDSPPESLGTITFWKADADMSDVSEDRKIYRRVMDFRARWQK